MNHNVKLNITEPLEYLRARDLKKNGKQRGCVIKGKTEKFLKYNILKDMVKKMKRHGISLVV